jgi:hypothetical protein
VICAGQIKFDRLFFVRTKFMLGLAAILVRSSLRFEFASSFLVDSQIDPLLLCRQIVIFSLVISVGLCASMGIHLTPIIRRVISSFCTLWASVDVSLTLALRLLSRSEVIPFLVLAIGIDNV